MNQTAPVGRVCFLVLMQAAELQINGQMVPASTFRQYLTAFVKKTPDQVIVTANLYNVLHTPHPSINGTIYLRTRFSQDIYSPALCAMCNAVNTEKLLLMMLIKVQRQYRSHVKYYPPRLGCY